ncbi:MAG: Lsr2 family protein [Bifidobacteriaceae bacterium]|jgi:hypothetical protein|nr:Lsr2 family protein [Bifidobacteriaceae bacterium]
MVQRVQYLKIDDLDGQVAQETVSFALDGARYEIDLTTEHAAELRAALKPWVDAGRRFKQNRSVSRGGRTKGGADDAGVIRAWARGQGLEVSDRGRIPVEVRQAYDATR